jgi:hypothetical protein
VAAAHQVRIRALLPVSGSAAQLSAEVERYSQYPTLELGDGLVTKGVFVHRPVLDRYPIPADLSGKRCRDDGRLLGVRDGTTRRPSVTALDLEDPQELD